MPLDRLAVMIGAGAATMFGVRYAAARVRGRLPATLQDVPELWPALVILLGAGIGQVNRDAGAGAIVAGSIALADNLAVRFGIDLT